MILNIHRLPANTMDLQHTQDVYHEADINKHWQQRDITLTSYFHEILETVLSAVGALFLQYNK
jgi:hypothetical protein